MDINFSPQDLEFQREVRAWFQANTPEALKRKVVTGEMLQKTISSIGSVSSTTAAGSSRAGPRNSAGRAGRRRSATSTTSSARRPTHP